MSKDDLITVPVVDVLRALRAERVLNMSAHEFEQHMRALTFGSPLERARALEVGSFPSKTPRDHSNRVSRLGRKGKNG